MKLYVTLTSPYARLARIIVIEKGLEGRVEIVEAKTRSPDSPYYRINPSGRVPYLVDDAGVGMEDSQVICAYLDGLDGAPRFHPDQDQNWRHRRLEASARSLLDGIAVWAREIARPESERSPKLLAHEAARAQRVADHFESEVALPELQALASMAPWVLAVVLETARLRKLGDLTAGRPRLAAWLAPLLRRPSMLATLPPGARPTPT
jgi:glutathione S-transferase